jgi:hypothetical protein
MRIVYEYSHLGGAEILQVRYPDIDREIREVISEITAKRTKISKEKTKRGKALYSPSDMNRQFKKAFEGRGYRELRHSYKLTIPNSDFTISGTFKQIDFVKDKVLIEVQLGKYFAMFYDIAKFQYFYNENRAEVGVEIVPCHALYREMSSGVSYGEKLIYDIEQMRRHFPAAPVKVILIDVDEPN